MEPEKAFGEVLRSLRRARNLSQEALALEADMQRNYVSLLELGKNSASVRVIFKLCAVLDVTPSQLFVEVENRMRKAQRRHE
ncbi:helix-turn-helix domain-containing protein [Burkholderia multivorans]|uniref:XRE family transcriptional regulator n=1 Tax=Burkholderia multivorans TaxID=87883 RepID=A0AB37AN18_9BURK|nr:helix-turn-helix transcriptional regulator [Burkholderia multivorans]PRE40533.1 XRE family transcriptional regulator [Burkholderia multivorans]PRE42609.1 XRE family transcriptional regulator [Burkholderia multivorans]